MLFNSIATRPADTDGCTVALVVTLPLAAIVIVAMATIPIIIAKQLKDARYTLILNQALHAVLHLLCVLTTCSLVSRTQLRQLSRLQTNHDQVYSTLTHEDISKTDVGGGSDHTYRPAIELSQCPAYAPTEVSMRRGGRRDVGEEGI